MVKTFYIFLIYVSGLICSKYKKTVMPYEYYYIVNTYSLDSFKEHVCPLQHDWDFD